MSAQNVKWADDLNTCKYISLEFSRSTASKLKGKYQASPEYGKNDEIIPYITIKIRTILIFYSPRTLFSMW